VEFLWVLRRQVGPFDFAWDCACSFTPAFGRVDPTRPQGARTDGPPNYGM
jgi:hypothetical protein